jgi:hypothetical protein
MFKIEQVCERSIPRKSLRSERIVVARGLGPAQGGGSGRCNIQLRCDQQIQKGGASTDGLGNLK